MLTTRLSFTMDAADADAVQRIGQDYRVPMARIVRDAVRMLLDAEPQYRAALLERLGYALPTEAQMEASQQTWPKHPLHQCGNKRLYSAARWGVTFLA